MTKKIIKKKNNDKAIEGELSQPMGLYVNEISKTKKMLNKGVDLLGIAGAIFPASDKYIPTPYRMIKNLLNIGAVNAFNEEIKVLQEKSKLKDFDKSKFGQQSFVDMLGFIDSNSNDKEKIKAVKALFFALNFIDNKDEDDFLNYEIFKIGMKLDALHFVILKTVDEINKNGGLRHYSQNDSKPNYAAFWLETIAKNSVIKIPGLVERGEKELIELNLITDRIKGRTNMITSENSRITPIGEKLVENLLNYSFEDLKEDEN